MSTASVPITDPPKPEPCFLSPNLVSGFAPFLGSQSSTEPSSLSAEGTQPVCEPTEVHVTAPVESTNTDGTHEATVNTFTQADTTTSLQQPIHNSNQFGDLQGYPLSPMNLTLRLKKRMKWPMRMKRKLKLYHRKQLVNGNSQTASRQVMSRICKVPCLPQFCKLPRYSHRKYDFSQIDMGVFNGYVATLSNGNFGRLSMAETLLCATFNPDSHQSEINMAFLTDPISQLQLYVGYKVCESDMLLKLFLHDVIKLGCEYRLITVNGDIGQESLFGGAEFDKLNSHLVLNRIWERWKSHISFRSSVDEVCGTKLHMKFFLQCKEPDHMCVIETLSSWKSWMSLVNVVMLLAQFSSSKSEAYEYVLHFKVVRKCITIIAHKFFPSTHKMEIAAIFSALHQWAPSSLNVGLCNRLILVWSCTASTVSDGSTRNLLKMKFLTDIDSCISDLLVCLGCNLDECKWNLVNYGNILQHHKLVGVVLREEDGMMILEDDGMMLVEYNIPDGDKEHLISLLWNLFLYLLLPFLAKEGILADEICTIQRHIDYLIRLDHPPVEIVLNWIHAVCEICENKCDNFSSLANGKVVWCPLDYYFCKQRNCAWSSNYPNVVRCIANFKEPLKLGSSGIIASLIAGSQRLNTYAHQPAQSLHPSVTLIVAKCFATSNIPHREDIVSALSAFQSELCNTRQGPHLMRRKLEVYGFIAERHPTIRNFSTVHILFSWQPNNIFLVSVHIWALVLHGFVKRKILYRKSIIDWLHDELQICFLWIIELGTELHTQVASLNQLIKEVSLDFTAALSTTSFSSEYYGNPDRSSDFYFKVLEHKGSTPEKCIRGFGLLLVANMLAIHIFHIRSTIGEQIYCYPQEYHFSVVHMRQGTEAAHELSYDLYGDKTTGRRCLLIHESVDQVVIETERHTDRGLCKYMFGVHAITTILQELVHFYGGISVLVLLEGYYEYGSHLVFADYLASLGKTIQGTLIGAFTIATLVATMLRRVSSAILGRLLGHAFFIFGALYFLSMSIPLMDTGNPNVDPNIYIIR